MITIILILVVVFIIGLGFGVAGWFVFRHRRLIKRRELEPVKESAIRGPLSFRWRYILLPLVILLLSIILVAYFYHLLPGEVAYHFKDGSPDKWTGRGAVIAWMLAPQFFFTLLAVIIVLVTVKLGSRFQQTASSWVGKMLSLMGNMLALPQVILGFAMLDIFSYNSYQIRLIPLWVFALIAMGLGGIILGVFFVQAIRRVWKTT
jgi:uncharacterized membrane protein